MSTDDRFERLADWHTLDLVRRFARVWQAPSDWRFPTIRSVLTEASVHDRAMPDGLFGVVVGARERHGQRWRIEINDRLPLAAANATLGHELGHTFQAEGLGQAFCAPRAGLPLVEQEAHAVGALLTVPVRAIRELCLGEHDRMRRAAVDLAVPATYVEIRLCLAILFGERSGASADAAARLNATMMDHQVWMSRIAALLALREAEGSARG